MLIQDADISSNIRKIKTYCMRIITNGLGVIIECFCIILLYVKGIALLFEALCFPV